MDFKSHSIPLQVLGMRHFRKWALGDPWTPFWSLVEAAGKLAEAEWFLACAGNPHDSDANNSGPKGDKPKPGFYFYKMVGEDDFLYDQQFPGNKIGLKKALRAVEEAKKDKDVSEILLEINYRKYLPGNYNDYCRPIEEWLRK